MFIRISGTLALLLFVSVGPAHAQLYRLPNNNTMNGSHFAPAPPGQPGYGYAFPAGSPLYGGPPYNGSASTVRDRKPIPYDDPLVPATAEQVRFPTPVRGAVAAPASAKPRPAILTLTVPVDTAVTVDGDTMFATGPKRVYVTPRLSPGVPHTLEVRLRWRGEGRYFSTVRTVTVTAGEETKLEVGK